METQKYSDPYYFVPLYTRYRRALQYIATRQDDFIHGMDLKDSLEHHDTLRQFVAWNFLSNAEDAEVSDYQTGITCGDFNRTYKVTKQTREYLALEPNNFADLQRAILIWLRADIMAEVRVGAELHYIPLIGFYELVMLLNKSESSVLRALEALESIDLVKLKLVRTEDGRVWKFGSKIDITQLGIQFLEKGVALTVNKVSIKDSTVGVFAWKSTLTSVETAIGTLNSQGQSEIAHRLTEVKEETDRSTLSDKDKKDLLEQVEVIATEAAKAQSERKPSIVKSAISYIGTIAAGAAGVMKVWEMCAPFLRQHFGI
jgi:hypothetical protein